MDITRIKGFKDVLPEEVGTWQRLEFEARRIFRSYGFQEIKPPLLEKTELFARGIGQETDIVSKEMYTFTNSKGENFSLRPEATASVVRAYIQHRLYRSNPVQKLFTIGPMFRHENPQKGRFRQFHQINAEMFGDPGPRSDAEIIIMAMTLLDRAGISDLSLNINSLGCPDCRSAFRDKLKGYLADHKEGLCMDCQRRAVTNPLRVFDCKVTACQDVVSEAPSILESICMDCMEHFKELQDQLKKSDINFIVNHRLVRGLDYYSRTAFEIQTDRLGSQNAVGGGGRYDGLVKQLGGPDHPAIGFAIGIERLVTLLDEASDRKVEVPDLFIACLGGDAQTQAFGWVNELRRADMWVEMEYSSKGLKAQMKRADRLGAKMTLIIGDDELLSGKAVLRDMGSKEQKEVALDNIVEEIKSLCDFI